MTRLAVIGAVAGTALAPSPVSADSAALDMSAHSYSFDGTWADSAGGAPAVVHGAVPFAAGVHDPPDGADRSARFDGKPGDYLTIARPAFDYGGTDFTLDLWLSTTSTRAATILDTRGGCGAGGGLALVLSGGGRLGVGIGTTAAGEDSGQANGGDGGGSHASERGATVGTAEAPLAASSAAARGDDHGGGAGAGSSTAAPGDDHARGAGGASPRANDGRWHEVTLSRSGGTVVVSLDRVAGESLTLPASADLDGRGDLRLGRGWCDGDDRGFTGELDDLSAQPTPPAALPETPLAAALPVSAVLVGAFAVHRRRHRRRPAHLRRR